MVKEIQLSKGYVSLVDDEDYDYLMQWKWHVKTPNKAHITPYAIREEILSYYDRGRLAKRRVILMHKFLIKPPNGLVTDHINGDGLDNRRENLRVCSISENCRNQRSRVGSSSKYKGVSIHTASGKWAAQIAYVGKNMHIGLFKTEIEAAVAYNDFAIKFHGEFAKLNIID